MAIKYGFFNSVNGDRKYTAADIGDYLRGIIYSGVYPDGTSSLQVLADGGMTVEVQPGRAMLEFKYLENDAPHQITLAAGGTMDRIDAIVAYMDLNERACGITVKQGTPAAAPVAPAMTRTDVRYEVMLASVYVTRLVNEVTQANITDTRHLTEVCGWVRGAIRQNTTDIPVPAPATAGYIPHVTQDGNGYELLAADTTLAIPGRAADAAAVGGAIKRAAPHNLLDNSDFRNPVNQRGEKVYAYVGIYMHTIDRWDIYSEGATVTVEDGYISKTKTLGQRIAGLDEDKNYTAAVCSKDGVVSVYSGTIANGIGSNYDKVYCYSSENDITIFSLPTRGFTEVQWAALYEGEYTAETLPEYQPKGYAAELLECRRYYQRINPGYIPFGFGWSNSTTPSPTRVSLPCSPMRIQPTVSFKGTQSNVRMQFNQGAVNVASIDGVHYKPEMEHIAIFMKPSTAYVGPFVAYCISDGEIFELSADL